MSKMETLERMLSHTTLSTQRALHTHILDLGDKYGSQSSTSSTSSRQAPRLPAPAPHAEQGEVGDTLEEDVWMEVFLRRAEEEREEVLRLQEETEQFHSDHQQSDLISLLASRCAEPPCSTDRY